MSYTDWKEKVNTFKTVDGKAVAVVDTTDENRNAVTDAIDVCPVSAIREEE